MKFKLRLFPAAKADIDAAALFISHDNMPAALRFYDSVDSTLKEIWKFPTRAPRYELDDVRLANLRKRSVSNFPRYLIFYRIDGNVVDVIRVLHGARDLSDVLLEELAEE